MPTPHIAAEPGEIAESVLLPGDPLRVQHIAENLLADVVQVTDTRNMYGFTGTYQGEAVSVMGTGMGPQDQGRWVRSWHLYRRAPRTIGWCSYPSGLSLPALSTQRFTSSTCLTRGRHRGLARREERRLVLERLEQTWRRFEDLDPERRRSHADQTAKTGGLAPPSRR